MCGSSRSCLEGKLWALCPSLLYFGVEMSDENQLPHWIRPPHWNDGWAVTGWTLVDFLPPASQMPSNLDFQGLNEYIYIVWVNMLISCEPFVTAAQYPCPNQYETIPRLHSSLLGFLSLLILSERWLSVQPLEIDHCLGRLWLWHWLLPGSHVWALTSPGDPNTVACESMTPLGF